MTHLDHSLSHLQKVLLAIRLGALLVPVNNRLVRHDVLVVEELDDLGEGLEDTGVGVARDLDGVDQADLGFGAVGERGEEVSVGLHCQLSLCGPAQALSSIQLPSRSESVSAVPANRYPAPLEALYLVLWSPPCLAPRSHSILASPRLDK